MGAESDPWSVPQPLGILRRGDAPLTCRVRFPNILTRAFCADVRVGVSSNGRTAVSGAVCEGSTPSTPANFSALSWGSVGGWCILAKRDVAPSSSGLGRRPLKAEVAGSNPVGATRNYKVRALSALTFSLENPKMEE